MDKKIEAKDKLFINVDSIKNEKWLINKRHIVSDGAPLVPGAITRIVLTTGAIIETYMNIGSIIGVTNEIEHKTDTEGEPK